MSNGDDHPKMARRFRKLGGLSVCFIVMGISLAAIYALWASFGYIGPSFSSDVLNTQQSALRAEYGLPEEPIITDPSVLQTPPSLRGIDMNQSTAGGNASSPNATSSGGASSPNATSSGGASSPNATSSGGASSPNATSSGGAITIPAGAATPGNPPFTPTELSVKKGEMVAVANNDNAPHTVTSGVDASDPTVGKSFDTSLIMAGASGKIDTSNMAAGEYPFHCTVHPFMKGKLTVTA
jgi:plastocyanin